MTHFRKDGGEKKFYIPTTTPTTPEKILVKHQEISEGRIIGIYLPSTTLCTHLTWLNKTMGYTFEMSNAMASELLHGLLDHVTAFVGIPPANPPVRVQRLRTKGWKMPPNTIHVGRPTKWGNPFRVGSLFSAQDAVDYFESWVRRKDYWENRFNKTKPPTIEEIKKELRGKNLACWCPLDKPCHADVLLKIANETN